MVIPGVATPESTLIARTRGGDMAAFDELYRQHVDEAVKVARIVCDDRDDVPDLVNEAFTRVLSRLTEGSGPDDDLGPYLRTIVRRLAVDRFHGQRRRTAADPEAREVLASVDYPPGACAGRAAPPPLVNDAPPPASTRLPAGRGPDDALGPYLRPIVRRLAVDRFHGQRRHTSADPESLEVLPTVDDPIGRAADKHLVR